jgi:hypothetical protein
MQYVRLSNGYVRGKRLSTQLERGIGSMKGEGSERVFQDKKRKKVKKVRKSVKHAPGMLTDVWFAGQTPPSTFTKENCKRV